MLAIETLPWSEDYVKGLLQQWAEKLQRNEISPEEARVAAKENWRRVADVENQINRADAKALGVVSVLAFVAGLIVALLVNAGTKPTIAIIGASTLAGFVVALIGALLVLKPRPEGSIDTDSVEHTMLEALCSTDPLYDLIVSSTQLFNRQRVLKRKHHMLRKAYAVLIGALALSAILVPLWLFVR